MLNLAGPMQSWGNSSRFTRRETAPEPTKSGVVGLPAAALGRRRTDPLEDLAQLRFGVRTEQQGRLERDFQTAQRWETGRSKPLSYRFYLADAAFLAAVEGPDEIIEGLVRALKAPTFPLYLGRRAYPPARPVFADVVDGDLAEHLRTWPWQAADWYRKKQGRSVRLPIVRDIADTETPDGTFRDLPEDFDPGNREYGWRDIRYDRSDEFPNPLGQDRGHDPLALLGGS